MPENKFNALYYILKFFRFYKWPLASNILITSTSYNEFVNNTNCKKFKLIKVDTIDDASSFTAHGVGAVHGEKDIYEIIPLSKNKNTRRKLRRKLNYQSYYSTTKEYDTFVNKVKSYVNTSRRTFIN